MSARAAIAWLVAAAICADASTAWAQVPANAPELSQAIYGEIDALARQTRRSGTLPRWSDAAQREVLARFWDEDALLGRPPHRSAEVPALIGIGESHSALLKTYLLFAKKSADLPDMAANGFEFQDEIARSMAFQIAVMAASVPALEDFIAGLPAAELTEIRRQGLRQMRLGFSGAIAGTALFARSPGLSEANRDIVAGALARHAASLARSLELSDRRAGVANAAAALPALAANARADMEAFIAAMSRTDCESLCAIP